MQGKPSNPYRLRLARIRRLEALLRAEKKCLMIALKAGSRYLEDVTMKAIAEIETKLKASYQIR